MNLKERLFANERAIEAEAQTRIESQFDSGRELVAASPADFVSEIAAGLYRLAAEEFIPRVAQLATDAADQIAIEAGHTPR